MWEFKRVSAAIIHSIFSTTFVSKRMFSFLHIRVYWPCKLSKQKRSLCGKEKFIYFKELKPGTDLLCKHDK